MQGVGSLWKGGFGVDQDQSDPEAYEQQHPDDVEEMPVEGADFEPDVSFMVVAVGQCIASRPPESDRTADDVCGVEEDQNEGIAVGAFVSGWGVGKSVEKSFHAVGLDKEERDTHGTGADGHLFDGRETIFLRSAVGPFQADRHPDEQ